MRILVLNWQDITNPLSGGAEVHLHSIFSRIARLGHEVTLFCSSYPGAPSEEVRDGMRIVRQGGRALFNLHVPLAYLQRFRAEPFDVVVDDVNKIPFLTPLYVRRPLFGIIHHLFGRSIFLEANPAVASYVSCMEHLGVWLYRRNAMPFFVVSPSTGRELQERGFPPERLHLVHNCVDHDVHRPAPDRRSPTPLIGVFGRLKKYKCVDQILRALPRVRERIREVRMVVVGEGDDRPRLENLARELGVQDVVTFTGFVPEQMKVDFLQRMWFGVTMSSKEGWGLTVLEANACGTPVIAADVPGLRDAVKDGVTGILTPFGDTPALADAILDLLQDTERRERLSREALSWAREFNWDTAAQKTIEALQAHVKTARATS
ncbi:MAG: glycosyltransferase family 4 protein [Bacteroidetes bacterium]|nr:glycosyltransferase family 4 protein [Bacteroidota bacterium]